jgi:hypothetical protein
MFLAHFIDEFVLQPVRFSSAKTRSGYKRTYEERYARSLPDNCSQDHYAVIVLHSIMWSLLVMVPIVVAQGYMVNMTCLAVMGGSAILHSCIDYLRLGTRHLNLWQEHLCYALQIIFIFVLYTEGAFLIGGA